MIQPTKAQIDAGCAKGRQALNNYSTFDSGMVPDDALQAFVIAVLEGALNAPPPKTAA